MMVIELLIVRIAVEHLVLYPTLTLSFVMMTVNTHIGTLYETNGNTCDTCPFACTDESERIQMLGCLPGAYEILLNKDKTGDNWACHSDETRICGGYAEYAAASGQDTSTGRLITLSEWTEKGFPELQENY